MLKLAIVGRPNVGKSALFNRICRRRLSIVEDVEGVTRDRLYGHAEIFGRMVEVIDTGGIDFQEKILFSDRIRVQVDLALREADAIFFVVDGTCSVARDDYEVAKYLRKSGKPIFLVVNKIDSSHQEEHLYDFYKLGFEAMFPVSVIHGLGIAELLEAAIAVPAKKNDGHHTGIPVAIVGRANVGKSTLLNYVLQEERSVVSDIPGTTRDAIDVDVTVHGERYTLIDTAGIRRKWAEKEVVDKFAAMRTEKAMRRSEVCILVIDALEGLTTQEKRIAESIEEEGKGCILFVNKWDQIKGFRMEHCLQEIRNQSPFLNHCPVIFGSALEGRNVMSLFETIKEVHTAFETRVTTGKLNQFVEEAMQRAHPAMIGGKRMKIYYMTQVSVKPPHFVIVLNDPKLMQESYLKFLTNQFRKLYPFPGVPLSFKLKKRAVKKRPEFLPALS